MARTSNLSDDALRDLIEKEIPQGQIALLYKISQAAVSQRVKNLTKKDERIAYAQTPEHAVKAVASVWDIRSALDENYRRTLQLLNEECETPGDKVRCVGEIRQNLSFAMDVMEKLYAVQETQAFMEEVLKVLDECEPGTRNKILIRLREKRSVRAAFFQV
jgi:predicted transcriptional regulator